MQIFSIICTRERDITGVAKGLVDTLLGFGVVVKLLVNENSIFEAYKKGLDSCKANPNDIIIFCHDDIQILNDKVSFVQALAPCVRSTTGIVGPAGTTHLGEDAVWWRQDRWAQGLHRGLVKHIMKGQPGRVLSNSATMITPTSYGPHGPVVALDGLFLAARKEVWDKVGLEKPTYFEGLWDFYDIHYTTKAHNLGFENHAVPIDLIHHSNGELVGRDSWHKNRKAFIANTELPLKI